MTTYIVYVPISAPNVKGSLGRPEYSYAFVLEKFRPVLESLGDVIEVTDPAREVDALYDALSAKGEEVMFLCFCPPHRAPVGLRCPMSLVLAWEFDSIPDHVWDDEPRNDWRVVLAEHGRIIVLASYTERAIARGMGDDFRVAVIPAPIFSRIPDPGGPRSPVLGRRSVAFEGVAIDSREFEFTDEGMTFPSLAKRVPRAPWDRRTLELAFTTDTDDSGYLVGFYAPEPGGTWSRVRDPWIMLPVTVRGRVRVDLVMGGHGDNIGRTITASLGGSDCSFVVPPPGGRVSLRFNVTEPAHVLQFRGLDVRTPEGTTDHRTLGLRLRRLVLRRSTPLPARAERTVRRALARAGLRRVPARQSVTGPQVVELDGVVYTSILNPVDGRKNWELMLYAFCYALRDEPEATLVLKMSHGSVSSYFADLQHFLHRVGPVACRVVVIQGFLSEDELASLTEATTYYANASNAEGLCMPLMEYLGAGVPAVAPNHTAMADYVTDDSCFVVESRPAYTHWPHDDRMVIRAHHYRVDWDSLVTAFRESFDVAVGEPERYRAMSRAARLGQERFSSDDVVRRSLREFIEESS